MVSAFPDPVPRWFARGQILNPFSAAFRPLFRLDLASPPGIPSEANQRALDMPLIDSAAKWIPSLSGILRPTRIGRL